MTNFFVISIKLLCGSKEINKKTQLWTVYKTRHLLGQLVQYKILIIQSRHLQHQ